jgi:hypothetical protein
MYESTLLAEALSTKSEIITILEDRSFRPFDDKTIERFYNSDIDPRVIIQVKNLMKKYNRNVEQIGKK